MRSKPLHAQRQTWSSSSVRQAARSGTSRLSPKRASASAAGRLLSHSGAASSLKSSALADRSPSCSNVRTASRLTSSLIGSGPGSIPGGGGGRGLWAYKPDTSVVARIRFSSGIAGVQPNSPSSGMTKTPRYPFPSPFSRRTFSRAEAERLALSFPSALMTLTRPSGHQ